MQEIVGGAEQAEQHGQVRQSIDDYEVGGKQLIEAPAMGGQAVLQDTAIGVQSAGIFAPCVGCFRFANLSFESRQD